jgi:hypothetical protein
MGLPEVFNRLGEAHLLEVQLLVLLFSTGSGVMSTRGFDVAIA